MPEPTVRIWPLLTLPTPQFAGIRESLCTDTWHKLKVPVVLASSQGAGVLTFHDTPCGSSALRFMMRRPPPLQTQVFWPPEGPLNIFDLNIQTRYNLSAEFSWLFCSSFITWAPFHFPRYFWKISGMSQTNSRMVRSWKDEGCGDYIRSPSEAVESESESHSVVSNSLQPHGLYGPWNFPGQNTGVGSLSLLQGIFPTRESNLGLLHCRQILYQLSYQRRLWRPLPMCLPLALPHLQMLAVTPPTVHLPLRIFLCAPPTAHHWWVPAGARVSQNPSLCKWHP